MDVHVLLAFCFAGVGFIGSYLLHATDATVIMSHILCMVCLLQECSDANTWRFSVGILQLLHACDVLYKEPKTRSHLTLWFNLLFGVSGVAGSPWILHGAAFLGAHVLLVAYVLLLRIVGDGNIFLGFYIVDYQQLGNKKTWNVAIGRSLILHVAPVIFAHLEFYRCSTARIYKDADWGPTGLWSGIVSPMILPLIYEQHQIYQYGGADKALWTLYRVPEEGAVKLANLSKWFAGATQLVGYRWLLARGGRFAS